MNNELFLILTTRHRDMFFGGDVHLFWGKNEMGYTAILQKAGLYTKEQVEKICDEDDIPIPISYTGFDKDFFESDEEIIKFPTLMFKTKEVDDLIANWRYEYSNRPSREDYKAVEFVN